MALSSYKWTAYWSNSFTTSIKLRSLCWPGRAIQIIIYQNMVHKTLKMRHLLKLFSFIHMVCMKVYTLFFSLRYYSITAVCQNNSYPAIVNMHKMCLCSLCLNSHHRELLWKECVSLFLIKLAFSSKWRILAALLL